LESDTKDDADDISSEMYVPTLQDILRCRVRTTGIVEKDFRIDGKPFRIVDVGGQRNERKKWIHCFSEVTAIIFVAAISEFDQCLFEADETNRLEEALNLFENTINLKVFRKTPIILFLNKQDIFKEKLRAGTKVQDYFLDYVGETYEDGVEWMERAFMDRNQSSKRTVYPYPTCATDTDKIGRVLASVKAIVINASLKTAGMAF
jgi:tRNA U34 5-carboxymethylaminomethyl modifying GTPase MnmE/TrmE